jgi:uncharacterized repeat protein (TIGR01451 family)
MVVPLPAEKLQLCRGVAAQWLARSRAAACRAASAGVRLGGAVALAAVASLAAQPAAQRPRGLVVSSTLERLALGGGADAPIPADTVASHADQLIVSVRFTNAGDTVLDTIRVTSPIPADVKYVAGSASGPGSEVLYSVDNGRSFGVPGELQVAAPDGGLRAADAADYTHVRWVLGAPLAVGATGIARFRAVPR